MNFDVKTGSERRSDPGAIEVTQASSQLPTDVTNFGITVRKSVSAPLMLIALYSPHGSRDARFLANYAYINLVDPITRSPGIGQVNVFARRAVCDADVGEAGSTREAADDGAEIVSAVQTQNTVIRPARSAGNRFPRASSSPMRSARRDGSSRRRSSDRSSSGNRPTAAWCACRTSRGSSWALRTIRPRDA